MSFLGLSQQPLSLSLMLKVGRSPLVQVAELVMVVERGPVAVRPAFQALVPLAAWEVGYLRIKDLIKI